ncbi:MAG: DUF2905 domain-containing protein [Verrucomicrobiae bacterium]|nr:DUF2905 domain-containing protein [Verrucomicrobiae bacterium]
MAEIGKLLVFAGLIIAVLGLVFWLGPKVPWVGRLPGDIAIDRPNFKFYFPLTTCVLLSLIATFIAWLMRGR